MLEYFVHLDPDDPPDDLVFAIADVPDDLSCDRVEAGKMSANWRAIPAPPELAQIGDEFARRGEHLLLIVPSALAVSENNWLINPQHPDFKKIVVHPAESLRYDPRMFRISPSRRRHKRE